MKKIIIVISLGLTTSYGVSLSIIPGEKVKLEKGKEIEFQKPINKESKKNLSSDKIVKDAKKYLGVRYQLGASTKSTKKFDCSSFVKHIYKKQGKKLPRTSYTQIKIGKKLSKKSCKAGDLIFFGDSKRRVGHVGIIIDSKKQLMIHASSAKGKVVISSYNTKYYNRKYRGVRRI